MHGDTNKHLAEPEISGGGWCLWHLRGFGSELQEPVNGLVQRSSRASFRTLPVLLFGSWPLNCERTVPAGRPVMKGEGGWLEGWLEVRRSAILLSSAAIWAGAPLLICRHVSAAQSLWLGSLTAQCGSSINQRHFQCPITETVVLGLSGADSSPIHLPARQKKAIVARRSLPAAASSRKTPLKLFSLGQANNKKGKLLVSGNRRGEWLLLGSKSAAG